jgi:hypothetical protein
MVGTTCGTAERAIRAQCGDGAVRCGAHGELDPGSGYGGELMGCAREVGCSGSRSGLGRKGEVDWAKRDFEPMKPGETQKGFIIFCI